MLLVRSSVRIAVISIKISIFAYEKVCDILFGVGYLWPDWCADSVPLFEKEEVKFLFFCTFVKIIKHFVKIRHNVIY